MKSNTSPTPFIIALIVAAAGLYWYFFMGSDTQLPLTVAVENPAQTKFQMLVSELKPISFNTGIFADPRFNALVDLSTTVSPEASGRLDPFAPIPGVLSGN